MTTKQNTAKSTVAVTVTAHGLRGIKLAGLYEDGCKISDAMTAVCTLEAKANLKEGRTCGTVRSGDEFMVSTRNALIASGRFKLDKKGICRNLDNYMSKVRAAVNGDGVYKHNKASDSKATASTKRGARQSVGEKSVVKLTIVKDAQPFDVAQGLRDAINSEKFRESYAELAAFLTDALNEFQGQ